jgi:hypothetical protein
MQETQADDSARFLSPLRAFLALTLVLCVGFVIWSISAGSSEADLTSQSDETVEQNVLSESEARRIFRQLDQQRLDAYRALDETLVDVTFTDNGPLEKRVRSEVTRLIDDEVIPVPEVRTTSLVVTSVAEARIRLRQKAIVGLRFKDAAGKDVTDNYVVEKQTIMWTLREIDGQWLLHNAKVLEVVEVRP